MPPPLRVAAAQFPVSGDMARNSRHICSQMEKAAGRGARVVQFPETALPGYGPKHLASPDAFDWPQLEHHTDRICQLAASLDLWVVLGSMRRVDGDALPRSSLVVISNRGALAGMYDKQRLHGRENEWYSAGTRPCVVEIGGFHCGFLICYDNCFPELYEPYRDQGVGLLFHSFYNAANRGATPIANLMAANLLVRAADNRIWIAASNSCERFSPLSACVVRPDGSMVRARRHVTGLAVDDYPAAALGWTYDNRSP